MEKIYNKMKYSGILSVIGGIAAIAVGLMVIIVGGLMLKEKSNIMF